MIYIHKALEKPLPRIQIPPNLQAGTTQGNWD